MKIGDHFTAIVDIFIDQTFTYLINIGSGVTLSSRVAILAHDASSLSLLGYTEIGKVTIEDGVFVGFGSIILPNTVIGRKTIVGAGSVVKGHFPPEVVIGGNPARVIRTLEEHRVRKFEDISNSPIFDQLPRSPLELSIEERERISDSVNNSIGFVPVIAKR